MMVAYVSRQPPFVWDPDGDTHHESTAHPRHGFPIPACGAPYDVLSWEHGLEPPQGSKLCDACRETEKPKVVTT